MKQAELQAEAGAAWMEIELVVTTPLRWPDALLVVPQALQALCERVNVTPPASPYNLRHTGDLPQGGGLSFGIGLADWAGMSELMIADVCRHKRHGRFAIRDSGIGTECIEVASLGVPAAIDVVGHYGPMAKQPMPEPVYEATVRLAEALDQLTQAPPFRAARAAALDRVMSAVIDLDRTAEEQAAELRRVHRRNVGDSILTGEVAALYFAEQWGMAPSDDGDWPLELPAEHGRLFDRIEELLATKPAEPSSQWADEARLAADEAVVVLQQAVAAGWAIPAGDSAMTRRLLDAVRDG